MLWLPLLADSVTAIAGGASSITPIGAATSSITDYIIGFGPLGIMALAFGWVLYKGLLVPAARADAEREKARTDLLEENKRLIAEKTRAEEQRDAALHIAQDQLVPLLINFTSATQSLLPLLQQLVSIREDNRDQRPGR